MIAERSWDTIVIGGGPAGTTAATLLAKAGYHVCLCEKADFPRFRIGESLLPAGNVVFEKLGIRDKLKAASFVEKHGAEFASEDGQKHVHIKFADGMIPLFAHTYQVERSRFDSLLMETAIEAGVHIIQPCEATGISQVSGVGWEVRIQEESGQSRTLRSRFVVDATGLKSFAARQLKWKRHNYGSQKRFAVFSQFAGVARADGQEGGNIIITRTENGWFWMIPLDADKTSVGCVLPMDSNEAILPDSQDIFKAQLTKSPFMQAKMAHAQSVAKFRKVSDYTTSCEQFANQGLYLCGDSATFLDPIFSSGVYLAMTSGMEAAESIHRCLSRNQLSNPTLERRYTRTYQKRVNRMKQLVDIFYDEAGSEIFLTPKNRLRLVDAVNSIVGGHLLPPQRVVWRFQIFRFICWLNKFLPLARRDNHTSQPVKKAYSAPLTRIAEEGATGAKSSWSKG